PLDRFDALLAYFPEVGPLRKEPSDDPNTVLNCAFILRSIGSGKVGVYVQLTSNFLVFGPDASGSLSKVRVLTKAEGRWSSCLVMWVAIGSALREVTFLSLVSSVVRSVSTNRADLWFFPTIRSTSISPRRERSSTDRKSTRLNSSHVSISYAVFCLKKKKIRKSSRKLNMRAT